MPDINDIHKFYEANLPGYKRKDILRINKEFLCLAGIPSKKIIKGVLNHFQDVKEYVCYDWLGNDEIIDKLPQNEKHKKTMTDWITGNKKNKNMIHFTDQSLMPYGKYKGQKMANVPADYLIWLLDNDKCSGDVKKYIQDNKSFLELESKQNRKQQNR